MSDMISVENLVKVYADGTKHLTESRLMWKKVDFSGFLVRMGLERARRSRFLLLF